MKDYLQIHPRGDCPGCGQTRLTKPFVRPDQPVVLNYRFADADAATRVPRRDVTLVQCRTCGLIFNATFEAALIPYDENYENRQNFSPAFVEHLEMLARGLGERHPLRGARVLEVGCGKGDFLRLLCRVNGAKGDGYDTSYEPGGKPEPRGLTFHCRYVTAAEVRPPFAAVICRHVVEHVPEIGAFLRELHGIAVACGDPVVVLETPRWEWVVEQRSVWDVFYEHCNYYPEATLAWLCRAAGFRVLRHRPVFGAQYQLLELRLARRPRVVAPPGVLEGASLAEFTRHAQRKLQALATAFAGQRWAVWGAGAKGVALINGLEGPPPRCVVDSNPAKQGGVLSGTRVPIVSPADPCLGELDLILIANPHYAAEIRAQLEETSFTGRTALLQ